MGTSTDRFGANGDLGIPFFLENCALGIIFGDTFKGPRPGDGERRSPVMLRSTTPLGQPYVFDNAAGITGDGLAPALISRLQREYGPIPTDGISFPETGDEIISYMGVGDWNQDGPGPEWATHYSGLAWSHDGNHFDPLDIAWLNGPDNQNPFQVMSMQREAGFVYVVSTRAGRQYGPMMLQRVPWDKMGDRMAWQCWQGGDNWKQSYLNSGVCKPILKGSFGEPSFRLLSDGTWVLSYLKMDAPDGPSIVTRTATSPTGPWSPEKIQLTSKQQARIYGGYIDPRSTMEYAVVVVSVWTDDRYDVSIQVISLKS
jgi:hypothetical protein